jgi:hypothetical protein
MCPVCLATAALIAGSIAATGGMTALVIGKVVTRKTENSVPTVTPSKEDHNG